LPPFAPVLLESMRAIGYSFETAVADIIDNAISADATEVSIRFSPYDLPYVAIIDDGHGMTSDELVSAMRHGSRNPLEDRGPRDLGRFGLGLKTASLSQCRRLTVASLKYGEVSSWSWDLDVIRNRQDWVLVGLGKDQISSLPHGDELLAMEHGTLILWQILDRIASDDNSLDQALEAKIDDARQHLALVFHRLLTSKPGGDGVYLAINNVPIEPLDPFLLGNKATQHLPIEEFYIDRQAVTVSPYILPHLSKLTRKEMEIAGGEEGLRRSQGFYIYRNERLICWGSWARLTRQEELTKLARVRVDIPNTLDHLWTLDIKKSSAIPPESLKQNLKRIIERIVERSRTVYTYRGKKTKLDGVTHIWERSSVRGGYAYLINSSHPLVSALRDALPEDRKRLLDDLLSLIQTCFPFDLLYVDMASDNKADNRTPDDEDDETFADSLDRLADVLRSFHQDDESLLKALCSIEPFARDYDRTVRTYAELKKRNA
jgi:Histidine kinase-, DNA gyrase B-, and HSP90-like ATPase